LSARKVFLDQSSGVFVADRDRCGTLETLLRIEQVEPGIAAFIYPETFHVAPRIRRQYTWPRSGRNQLIANCPLNWLAVAILLCGCFLLIPAKADLTAVSASVKPTKPPHRP